MDYTSNKWVVKECKYNIKYITTGENGMTYILYVDTMKETYLKSFKSL